MHEILGKEKEDLRTAGKNDKGKKDLFAGSKLKVVDAVIDQAPNVEAILTANKSIKSSWIRLNRQRKFPATPLLFISLKTSCAPRHQ